MNTTNPCLSEELVDIHVRIISDNVDVSTDRNTSIRRSLCILNELHVKCVLQIKENNEYFLSSRRNIISSERSVDC